jgi:hypothetical protein
MAFGQASGPPATAKQVQELLGLVQEAGHADFREARGPLGLSQRQAGGHFTRDEADAFLDRLRDGGPAGADRAGAGRAVRPVHDAPAMPRTAAAPMSPAGGAPPPARAPGDPTAARARRPQAAPARGSTAQALRVVPDAMLAAELQRRGWMVIEPLSDP